jgi:AcrR family transcriptional regulator
MSTERQEAFSPSFSQRVRALREEEIIAAGSGVFGRQGCFAFKVEDVALQAGVAKGSIYAHFRSKEQMLQAVLARLEAQVLAEYERRSHDISSESADRAKLVLAAEILLELERECQDLSRSLLGRLRCSLENSGQSRDGQQVEALVGSVIEESQRSGLLKDTFPAATLAELFVEMATCRPFRKMSHGAGCRRAAEAAVDFFLQGVGS